jgi:hypothetical protein
MALEPVRAIHVLAAAQIGRIPGTILRDGGADSLRKGKALSQPNRNAWLIQEALFSAGCRPFDCIRVKASLYQRLSGKL